MACYNGQDVVVNELIECGANVNQVNEKGFAPLHFTAASRHGALCLELLVCNGADVNIKVGQTRRIASLCLFGKNHYSVDTVFQLRNNHTVRSPVALVICLKSHTCCFCVNQRFIDFM